MSEFIEQVRHPIVFINERREVGRKNADLKRTFGGFAKTLDLFYEKRKSLKEGQGASWKQGFSCRYYFPDSFTWLTTGHGLDLTMPLVAGQPVILEVNNGSMMTDSISVRSQSSSAVIKGESNVGQGHPYFDYAQPDRLINISNVEVVLSTRDLAEFNPALAGLTYVNITSREITLAPSARIPISPGVSLEIQAQQYGGSSDDHKSPYGRLQRATFFPQRRNN